MERQIAFKLRMIAGMIAAATMLFSAEAKKMEVDEAAVLKEANEAYDSLEYARAMELYMQIPENAEAQYKIGRMYLYKLGVEENYKEARKWFEKSAKQNYGKGLNGLGHIYASGNGVKKDYTKAKKYFELAVEQGSIDAYGNLGYMYYSQ
ncbi:MAG: sel1 repeat family protein [Lachnospiraceae bacterium]|nr:sel1 repeat family protein [Lachnospiraceae bacterium]